MENTSTGSQEKLKLLLEVGKVINSDLDINKILDHVVEAVRKLGYDLFSIMLKEGDFIVKDITIEVGGKSKTASQVKGLQHYLVAADDIETGIGTKVPLWLFGFLY